MRAAIEALVGGATPEAAALFAVNQRPLSVTSLSQLREALSELPLESLALAVASLPSHAQLLVSNQPGVYGQLGFGRAHLSVDCSGQAACGSSGESICTSSTLSLPSNLCAVAASSVLSVPPVLPPLAGGASSSTVTGMAYGP